MADGALLPLELGSWMRSVCTSVHYVLGQHRRFAPLHNLFQIFHIFSIIERLCRVYLASRQLWAISIVMESSQAAGSILFSQWQWRDEPPSPSPHHPFMSSALCTGDCKHFLTCSYGKCDIYKRDHPSACVELGVIWCPWVKSQLTLCVWWETLGRVFGGIYAIHHWMSTNAAFQRHSVSISS